MRIKSKNLKLLVLTWVEQSVWLHGQLSLMCLVWCETFSILNFRGTLPFFRSCSHTVYGYMWISPACYKHASVPKGFAWEVERPEYVCYLFSKYISGETHARWYFEALSEAITRHCLNFMKNIPWGSTSRLSPNSRKTSARAENPIITVSTRRWHPRNARMNYFWKHKCIMKSRQHFQNR